MLLLGALIFNLNLETLLVAVFYDVCILSVNDGDDEEDDRKMT